MQTITEFFYDWMYSITNQDLFSQYLATLISGVIILVLAFIMFLVGRKILFSITHRIARKTVSEWDDILLKNKTIHGIAHLVPASFIYFSSNYAGMYFPKLVFSINKLDEIYFLVIVLFTVNAFLTSINEIYNKSFSFSKDRPITGVVQLLKIFLYFVGFLFLITIVFDKELSKLLTGLGAVAAILLLVFKDAILGFVASMQISMNDMVKIGDWIEMPSRNADGEVLEINLTTVKVQNWDKTLSMIPTYSLITETFVNWKGMQQSGGRQIKRSINIDMTSVCFCDETLLKKLNHFTAINKYVEKKKTEFEKINSIDINLYNQFRLTNLELFRVYLESYLKQNKLINSQMTFMVRYLQSDNYGLPVEIFVFSKEKKWENYEALQASIIDHVLAMLPEFELRVFQSPISLPVPKN